MKTATLAAVLAAGVLVSGCSAIDKVVQGAEDYAVSRVQSGAETYCERPEEDRAAIRARFMTPEGPAIEVHCERVEAL